VHLSSRTTIVLRPRSNRTAKPMQILGWSSCALPAKTVLRVNSKPAHADPAYAAPGQFQNLSQRGRRGPSTARNGCATKAKSGHDPSIGSGQVVSCPNKERKDGEINSPLQMEGQRGRSGAAPLQGIGEKGARLSPSTRLLAKRRLIQNRWRK
jgi:hypothetical protein